MARIRRPNCRQTSGRENYRTDRPRGQLVVSSGLRVGPASPAARSAAAEAFRTHSIAPVRHSLVITKRAKPVCNGLRQNGGRALSRDRWCVNRSVAGPQTDHWGDCANPAVRSPNCRGQCCPARAQVLPVVTLCRRTPRSISAILGLSGFDPPDTTGTARIQRVSLRSGPSKMVAHPLRERHVFSALSQQGNLMSASSQRSASSSLAVRNSYKKKKYGQRRHRVSST